MECQRCLAVHFGLFMLLLVTNIHCSDIYCIHCQKQQRHRPCRILRMRVHGASTIFHITSSLSYVVIGCRHPFTRYWKPLMAKTTSIMKISVNSFSCCIFGNCGIVEIFTFRLALLTTVIGKITVYQRWNTDSELINIVSCKSSKNILLDVKNVIFIWYC